MKGKNGKKYAIKTMKKAEIINSKHVDHIENEKNILERVLFWVYRKRQFESGADRSVVSFCL